MNHLNAHEIQMAYAPVAPKKTQVENMFNEIAHSYDALNHILSLGVDKVWRKSAIKYLRERSKPDSILDVATGTGDFAILANKLISPKCIIGVDISEKMLHVGQEKIDKLKISDVITLRKEDCSSLSFPDHSFDAVISSFGLRNFENLGVCLKEMHRVLKPGGNFVIIDLCTPRKFPMKHLFWCYKKMVMPLIGRKISHNNHAYTYLPHSMDIIPQADEMVVLFESSGFKNVEYKVMPFQMCIQYSGIK